MRLFFPTRFSLCLLLLACATAIATNAQQSPESTAPKPAARSMPPVIGPNDELAPVPEGQLLPDTTPLTGLLTPALGTPELEHSFVTLGAQFGSTIESPGASAGGWYSNNYFLGNLSLVKNWRHAQTSINYSGGGYVSTDSSQGNGMYQDFSFLQDFRSARWDFSIADAFSYLPQSQFGFAGGTNIGVPGTGSTPGVPIPGTGSGPSQDIYSATGKRYSNTAIAQANYTISARDSLTFSGSYQLLRFSSSGNIDNDTIIGGVGYNRQLTKLDTIGFNYTFTAYHYSGLPQSYGSQSIGFAYGRKITGRLALQFMAGPQINSYRIPIDGNSQVVTGFVNANLSYGLRNGAINFSYNQGLSNGSGVLIGSQQYRTTVSATHRLGRVWSGLANFGFSRNTPIDNNSEFNTQSYNDWYFGVGVSRPFGRSVQFSAAYSANFEKAELPGCTSGTCNTDFTQHIISLSLQWHTRPFVLH